MADMASHLSRLEEDKEAMRTHFQRELQALEAECAHAERCLHHAQVGHAAEVSSLCAELSRCETLFELVAHRRLRWQSAAHTA